MARWCGNTTPHDPHWVDGDDCPGMEAGHAFRVELSGNAPGVSHPKIPEDVVIVSWFVGASLDYDPRDPQALSLPVDRIATPAPDWQGGEVSLAWSEIGNVGGGSSRAVGHVRDLARR